MKAFALILVMVALSACGFTPVYAPSSSQPKISDVLSSIAIDVIPDESGQIVRNHLIDRMPYNNGYPVSPTYRLSVAPIQESIIEIGIDRDDEASRAQLRQSTTFTLIRIDDDKTILNHTVRAVSSYNILSGQFTTFITEQDARAQALRALSDNIITTLEVRLHNEANLQTN